MAPARRSPSSEDWQLRLRGAVSEFFEIDKRGSTIGAEVRAGVVSFLTMCYILLVNPQILSQVSEWLGRLACDFWVGGLGWPSRLSLHRAPSRP